MSNKPNTTEHTRRKCCRWGDLVRYTDDAESNIMTAFHFAWYVKRATDAFDHASDILVRVDDDACSASYNSAKDTMNVRFLWEGHEPDAHPEDK